MFDKPHEDAELKEAQGLEYWAWRENGILQIELTGKGAYTDKETEQKFKGNFVSAKDLSLILTESADVYSPRGVLDMFSSEDNKEERIIVSYRKGVIPLDICRTTYDNLQAGAELTDNRGTASGPVDFRKLPKFMFKFGDPVLKGSNKNRAFYLLEDGSVSKTSRANMVRSGQCGYFGPNKRFPFAREAGYSKSNPEKVAKANPYFKLISDNFRSLAPTVWQRQYDFLMEHKLIENGWVLGESVYTTVTINKNFRTACHQDAGDYSGGLGNISVLENPDKPFAGGYVAFPQWKCGVDLRMGDILVFAIHQYHGNTAIKPVKRVPEGEDEEEFFERMSLVCYARENMKNAGTKEEEALKKKEWKEGYKNSSELSRLNLEKAQEHRVEAESEFLEMMEMLEKNTE